MSRSLDDALRDELARRERPHPNGQVRRRDRFKAPMRLRRRDSAELIDPDFEEMFG